MAADTSAARPVRHRPRTTTVFVAAFVAGAVAAVGVNRALDVRLAQAKPQVECEPVFVALRAMPAGAPVTVWDVALRDLPKAMVPATALRVTDSFAGHVLKFPLREGQPLISAQLVPPEVVAPVMPETPTPETDAPESLVEEAFVTPIPALPAAVEAGDPITESRETVTSMPFDEEPAPGLASETASDLDSESEPATTTAPEDEPGSVVSITEVDATTATSEPEVTPAPQVTATEPTPVAAPVEPTPASPLPGSAAPPVNPLPASLSSDLFAGPAAGPLDATLDMPSRPAASLADLPSVMASGEAVAVGPATTGASGGVRYLVVPERIARQVDTAFTTPAPPEAAGPAKPAVQPERGSAATRPSTPAPPQQPGRGTSATKQQQSRPQPAKSAARPAATVPQPTGPRAWGGMFPNVAAGLEAMGSWRGGGRPAPSQTDRGSTTR